MTKTLRDYAHLDIDQMNGKQLIEYGRAVTQAAVEVLLETDNGEAFHDYLCTVLSIGALGTSEIAFGLMVGRQDGTLTLRDLQGKRVIGLKDYEQFSTR